MKTAQAGHRSTSTAVAHRAAGFCLLLVMVLALSACKPVATAAADPDPTGEYTLVTVNEKTLPATVAHGDTKLEVRSGTFLIKSDGTCSSAVTFVVPSGDEILREVEATYTQQGSTLQMQWKGAGKTTGTVEGNTFTMNNEGMIFAYEK